MKSSAAARWIAGLLILALAAHATIQTDSVTSHPRMQRRVLVSLADHQLAVIENEKVLAYFPIAVGAVSPCPIGEFDIVSRVANPTYYHDGVIIPAGEDSAVGTRWLGFNIKSYGIHGTNAPRSVGHASSHGCIRLKNRDVEKLYAMLRVGDVVQIRDEPDEEIAGVFGEEPDLAAAKGTATAVG
jgi:lipoprotein-anchoring transpeptidase ErfK/SrfK